MSNYSILYITVYNWLKITKENMFVYGLFCCLFTAFGLRYMREMNVSHLDLKPQNILLSSMHNPVLKIGGMYQKSGLIHFAIQE